MAGYDVEIVGAGVAGLSLALLLAREGVRVRVWEQEYPGYGPSGRSAGLLVTILPDHLLDVALDSLRFYTSLPGSSGAVKRARALWIPVDQECASRLLESHSARGLEAEYWVDPSRVIEGYRAESPGAIITEYIVDTGWVVNTLQQEAARAGVELAAGRVERRDGWFEARGERLGDTVVVAAGAWTGGLLGGPGWLVSYRCQLSSVEGPTPPLVVEDDDAGFYIVPVSRSRFNIGDGSNTVIADPWEGYRADLEDTLRVLEAYASRVPGAWESRIIQYWSAPCNSTPTGDPVAHRLEDGLYVLSGFNGSGITLAPGTAALLAKHLLDASPLPEWARPGGGEAKAPVEPFNICG